VVLNERLNAKRHGVLPAFGGHGGYPVEPGRDSERQQIEERRADPGVASAFVRVEVPSQFLYQRGDKRGVRVSRGEPYRGEFPDVVVAHRQESTREQHDRAVVPFVDRHMARAAEIHQKELTRRQPGLSAILFKYASSA
jgi:hypothetical protein